MANCKVCGKSVRSAPIVHERCMKRVIEDVQKDMCDDYCRYTGEGFDKDALEEMCSSCPMNRLHQLCG